MSAVRYEFIDKMADKFILSSFSSIMSSTIQDFKLVLETFFPISLPFHDIFVALSVLVAIIPLIKLHQNQRTQPRQPGNTAWLKSAHLLFKNLFSPQADVGGDRYYFGRSWVTKDYIGSNFLADLDGLLEMLGIDLDNLSPMFPIPPLILVTPRLNCINCESNGLAGQTLRRLEKPQKIRVLNENFQWQDAHLFPARCVRCRSDYYPDRVTFSQGHGVKRMQRLESDCQYLRVSMHGIWMHRRIALAQERAVVRFHAGWSNFADWLNETIAHKPAVTPRQAKRLFIEHFARRLLQSHGKFDEFVCEANLDADGLALEVREAIGRNYGVFPSAMMHSCMDCTHKKRYRSDLIEEGPEIGQGGLGVAEMDEGVANINPIEPVRVDVQPQPLRYSIA
jgi:hypothetical protein